MSIIEEFVLNWSSLGFVLFAYLVGSIPFGVLGAKVLNKTDPRGVGSGNIGFTNVLRVSGFKAGLIALVGDFGKGLLVVWLAWKFFSSEGWMLISGFSVIAGHIFSIFLHFSGGKGVATALGAILGIEPVLGSILLGIWAIIAVVFKYSSGAAVGTFFLFPFISFFFQHSQQLIVFSVLVSLVIIIKHKENIRRLLQGTESKLREHSS